MRKKLLFLIPSLKHGGAEKVLVNLVNNLDREKYDITVESLFDEGVNKKSLLPHIKYCSFMKHQFRGNSYMFKCFSPEFWWNRIVGNEHYDIAISYLEGPTTRILSGCQDKNTRLIAWLHIELNTPKLASQGFRNVEEARKAYMRFDRVVAVSKNVRECFFDNLGIQRNIGILYNTNETDEIREKAVLAVSDVRFLTEDVPTVCSVAKLMKTKGFDRLVEVHKRLINEGIKHRIYILGIGEEQNNLESLINDHRLERSFVLLGFDDNPYKYVSKCDLYVCSSRREGFSTAVTEALIVGTPVVSTECSGARELLGENNEYGIVVENSEEGIYKGMKRMLTDPSLLAYYKEQAKIRGAAFSKEKTVKAVQEMLDTIAG